MKGAYPLHGARHDSAPIERAALRTLNAACKRVYILCCYFGEVLLALFDKGLNSIKYILIDDARVGPLCIETVFLTTIGMLIERNCRLTIGLLIEAIADILFIP